MPSTTASASLPAREGMTFMQILALIGSTHPRGGFEHPHACSPALGTPAVGAGVSALQGHCDWTGSHLGGSF